MNKKYLWLLMLPLFLMMFFPKNTYASASLQIDMTRMEIYGYNEGSNDIVLLGGCDDCNVVANYIGQPVYVKVYFPRNQFQSWHNYEVSWSFQFKSNVPYNIWPESPKIFFNDALDTSLSITQENLEWTNTLDTTAAGNYVRENFYKGTFVGGMLGTTDANIGFYMPLTNYSSTSGDYNLVIVNFGISISDTTEIPPESDDPVSDLAGTNVKLDELKQVNMSIWDYVVEIFSTLLNLPLKIGEKIGELLDNLSIWDTIVNIYNFVTDIPRKIGETFRSLLESLFVPSDGFYENTIDKYSDDITNSLGMLWFPFDFIEYFVSKYVSLETNPVINIPNIKDPVYGVTLIEARSFNIQEIFQHGAIGTVYNIYMVFAGAFIVVLFINFLIRKFNHIVNGNESGVA